MAKAKKVVEAKKVRSPIVAVMGHVDHGKTTFLDAIRGTKVADKEAGGITQNTRAHKVVTKSGFKITFLDTPGHEAFSKMRERGAKVTDFVLLIVAADDGVQPQTKESIEFAKRDGVPIIVAINKVDISGIKTQKIKTELASFGVNIEEYGGETMCFEISAKNKTGLDELLEGIELLSEINELKSVTPRHDAIAEAFILESSLDKQIGNVALAVLEHGNITGRYFGVTKEGVFKVRAYLDENQKGVQTVTESEPFWITGLKGTLHSGDSMFFYDDEKKADDLLKSIKADQVTAFDAQPVEEKLDAESLFAQMLIKREEAKQGLEQKSLNVVVKSSTQGTLEAIIDKLSKISTEEAKVSILFSGTGNLTEDELSRAKLAKAIVVTFQLPTPSKIESMARVERVLVRNYEVIYEMFDEVEEVLSGMGEPIEEEVEVARAKIKQIFTLTNGDIVAGSEVIKGLLLRGYRVWVERKTNRGNEEIGRGKISSLKIRKEEVKEVKKGSECGIVLEPKVENLQEGDEIVAYKIEKI
ncbi:MAG: translation initiation factor IF-2 [Candidatus Dojkabacteria bacterium]